MAQGKFKVKTKVPNQKQKQKQKGKAFTRRASKYEDNIPDFLRIRFNLLDF